MGDTLLGEKGSVMMENVKEVNRRKKNKKGKESRFGNRYGFDLKLRRVKLHLEEGVLVSLLSKEVGVSKSVVHHWVKAYQERGEAGLRDKVRSSGSRWKLPAPVRKKIEQAEKSGHFRPAVDKAIFEAGQNPGERQRYIKVIQNLASKTIHATEQEKEKVEKEGLTDRAASLGRRIEDQKFMSERAEDIINVASKFYNDKLVELGEKVRREARRKEREGDEWEERRTEELEKAGRKARKKQRRGN